MRQVTFLRSTLRRARFERFEDRLVLSTNPLADVCVAQTLGTVSPLPDWGEIAPALAPLGAPTRPTEASYVREAYGFSGAGQTVAIIDSGIAFDHPALGAGFGDGYRVVGGWDFTEENDANPHDDGPAGFHGTHIAGIIASQDIGRPGVAPGVDLVALRVFNDMGMGDTQWVEQALTWVHEHRNDFRYPITTVNLSLGSVWNGARPPQWAELEEELATLADDGIFVVVAAGNSFPEFRKPGLTYPAASPYVVPVASMDDNGQLSDFSQRLDGILSAPGENIISTVPEHIFGADGDPNDWTMASGTSMAAPYLAGASVLVRDAMQFTGTAAVDPAAIVEQLRATAKRAVDSSTGITYYRLDLAQAIDSLMPPDDFGSGEATSFNLGTIVDIRAVRGQLARLDDRDYFRFTAAASGEVALRLSSTAPVDVGFSSSPLVSTNGDATIRQTVEAGASYTFAVSARDRVAGYDIQLELTSNSPVQVKGDTVVVNGTPGPDVIQFAIGRRVEITVNGRLFTLPRDEVRHFALYGHEGRDSLTLEGSAGSDEVILRAGSAVMTGGGYSLTADGFTNIRAIAGNGQDDVARFHGTARDDAFIATPAQSTMRGATYVNRAVGFDRTYAYAAPGGNDVARFYDSTGNDEFVARDGASLMRGAGFFNKAIGFDRVHAYGSKSGDDVARLHDSRNNDEFVAGPDWARVTGPGYFSKALNFNRTYAYATQGSDDVARLFDSAGNDVFIAAADASFLRGDDFFNKAIGFDRVYARATDGNDDVARFYDTPGNDTFVGDPRSSVLRGTGYYNKASQFDRVYVYASAGADDVARLTGSAADDRLFAWMDRQVLRGAGFYTDVRGFDRTYADLMGSNDDTAYLYDSPADEHYSARPELSVWRSDTSRIELRRFRRVSAVSAAGGHDVVELQLDGPATQFIGSDDLALGIAQGTQYELRGFTHVTLNVERGKLDALYLSSVDYLFSQIGTSRVYGPQLPNSR